MEILKFLLDEIVWFQPTAIWSTLTRFQVLWERSLRYLPLYFTSNRVFDFVKNLMLDQSVPLLNQLFVLQPEPPWSIHFGMNAVVDFCIWILEVDGLHVPPFTCHERGLGSLQRLGLTPQCWESWATAVLAIQNPILSWNRDCKDLDAWVAQEFASLEQFALVLLQQPTWAGQTIDFEGLRYSLECRYQQSRERYNKARSQIALINNQLLSEIGLGSDKELPAACLMAQPLRTKLQELWDIYNEQVYSSRVQATASLGEQMVSTGSGKLYDLLDQLNVYVVSYPFNVEWLVPPDTVVTSNRHLLPETDALDELIERAVRQLAV